METIILQNAEDNYYFSSNLVESEMTVLDQETPKQTTLNLKTSKKKRLVDLSRNLLVIVC